jgi:hypothetical protein
MFLMAVRNMGDLLNRALSDNGLILFAFLASSQILQGLNLCEVSTA